MTRKTTRNPSGGGTLRKRLDGRWEARCTLGMDPKTGKQRQKSVYGRTQREARQKLSQIVAELDAGTYHEPCKITLGEWLDIWLEDYQSGVKESTAYLYRRQAELYLRPALGKFRLEQLDAHTIQHLYNQLAKGRPDKDPLSPKTIKISTECSTRRSSRRFCSTISALTQPQPARYPGRSRRRFTL